MNFCFFALCSKWDSHIIPISRYGNYMGIISECYWKYFGISLGMIFIPCANGNLWFELASSFCKKWMCRPVFKKCFVLTHNFWDILNSCRLVVREKRMWSVVTLKVGENCKLRQEASTLANELRQPLKLHNRERMYFFTSAGLDWNCS